MPNTATPQQNQTLPPTYTHTHLINARLLPALCLVIGCRPLLLLAPLLLPLGFLLAPPRRLVRPPPLLVLALPLLVLLALLLQQQGSSSKFRAGALATV